MDAAVERAKQMPREAADRAVQRLKELPREALDSLGSAAQDAVEQQKQKAQRSIEEGSESAGELRAAEGVARGVI